MVKYKANRNRYVSDVDFYDILYDASWRERKMFSNRIDAAKDEIKRVNQERSRADPGVYVAGSVYKRPPKIYHRK